ncbi:MAG TPA: CHRD domain-containing protein [Cyclobacteriaceae bacterium]|nr:CHRD domain-containing protein [Cyclobacteriaceae bacterium]
MQIISKSVTDKIKVSKGGMMWLSFFLFAGCALQDEGMSPSADHDNNVSKVMNSESTRLAAFGVGADSLKITMNRNFNAHLEGANEIPATGSEGQGEAIFQLNREETEIYYKLNVANTKDITQAHIHCGGANVNGPVVVFLFGFNAEGVNQNGTLAEGKITSEDIIPRDSSAACMDGLATFGALLEHMRSGEAYVNVHTLAFPGGEIRGQIRMK